MKFLLFSILLLTNSSFSSEPQFFTKNGTPEENEWAAKQNLQKDLVFNEAPFKAVRPVEDYGNFKYLLINGYHFQDSTQQIKKTILQNLPNDVKVIVLTLEADVEKVQAEFTTWIAADKLMIITHEHAKAGFWSRDSFPIPVFKDDKSNVGLVAHRYFRKFEAQKTIAGSVEADLYQIKQYFVGGNLLADDSGQCFTIDSPRLYNLTEEHMNKTYGCAKTQVLPWMAGIGDVDEVLKPLPGKKVITNIKEYVPTLKDLGYTVYELPKLEGNRTYANSIFVGKTVFMPAYGLDTDAAAIKVYEDLGYTVVPVDSVDISDKGAGSLHCITMLYPEIDVKLLAKLLGGKLVATR